MQFSRYILSGSVLTLLFLLLFANCSYEQTFRQKELNKLDPVLRSIVIDGSHPGPLYDVQKQEDGSFLLGVIIRTEDIDRLRQSDIPLLETGGGTATARLTRAQIKEAVRIRGVQYIELATISQPDNE